MPQVTIIGSLTLDHNRGAGSAEFAPRRGGVVTYAGLTYRQLGYDTGLVFRLGPTDSRLAAPFHELGFWMFFAGGGATTSFRNRTDGDRRRQELLARAQPIDLAVARPALAGAELVHLGPLHPDDVEPDVAEAAAATDAAVALDLQGLCRRLDGTEVGVGAAPEVGRFLDAAGYVKADSEELQAVLAGRGPRELVEAHGLDELVETRGSRGGVVYTRAGAAVRFVPPSVVSGDATGAGDVFFAAYLAARVLEEEAVEQAAAGAAAAAAEHVAGRLLDAKLLGVAPAE